MKTWKKIACGLLAACMLLGAAGCAGGGTPDADPSVRDGELRKARKDIDRKIIQDRDSIRKVKPDKPAEGGADGADDEIAGSGESGEGEDGGVYETVEFEVHDPVYGFDGALVSYVASQGRGGRNFLVSPVSFRAALCLAIAGAGSETRASLLAAAGFDGMDAMEAWAAGLAASVGSFRSGLSMDGGDRAYEILFSVWNNTDVGAGLKRSYVDYVSGTLGATAGEEAAKDITAAIDRWADESTHGLIPSMGGDYSAAAAVLANAVYLRSSWLEPFEEHATKDETFHAADGSEREMAMMNMTDSFLYGEYDGGRYLVVPMAGDKYFVARLGDDIELDPAAFTAALAEMHREEVRLTMPKLDMETTWNDGELTGYLAAHSAASAMHPDYADFTKMSDGKWYIDQVVQKARLKTDEDGLEAAAVTTAQVVMSSLAPMEPADPVEFRMDVPFSFVILSGDVTDAPEEALVLFAGQFTGVD